MPRYLAIDYGSKRIGLAIGGSDGTMASPLKTIEAYGAPERDARAIASIALEYGIDAFVVGLPLNMDGTEGPQARIARDAGRALAQESGLPVEYWDERLSSFAAEDLIGPRDSSRPKHRAKVDRVAAQLVLQDYLESHGHQS